MSIKATQSLVKCTEETWPKIDSKFHQKKIYMSLNDFVYLLGPVFVQHDHHAASSTEVENTF